MKLIITKSFEKILKNIDHSISKQILDMVGKDLVGSNNFIEVGETNDVISFTAVKKAKALIDDKSRFIYTNSAKCVDLDDKEIIDLFDITGIETSNYLTQCNYLTGDIQAEVFSEKRGETFALIKIESWLSTRFAILNKKLLMPNYSTDCENFDSKFNVPMDMLTTSRNNLKIGRFVKSLLPEIKDQDLEKFVNLYKSTFDTIGDKMKYFEVVEGDRIAELYHSRNYVSGSGTLNNSCMSRKGKAYFKLYTNNSMVKMLILKDETDQTKIKGRAIMWYFLNEETNEYNVFLDRIYTIKDSDIELFKKYAIKNGFWFKTQQNSYSEYMSNGVVEKRINIKIELDDIKIAKFPYLDTIHYIMPNIKVASNISDSKQDNYCCRTTNGSYEFNQGYNHIELEELLPF